MGILIATYSPNDDGLVCAARCQAFSVRAECHAGDRLFMSLEVKKRLALGHIPNSYCVIPAISGQPLAIWAKCKKSGGATSPLKFQSDFFWTQVPNYNSAV